MVEPTVVESGFGLNAVVVNSDAPETILTVADGFWDGAEGESSQATRNATAIIVKLVRIFIKSLSRSWTVFERRFPRHR
jgi:hypothetical protein